LPSAAKATATTDSAAEDIRLKAVLVELLKLVGADRSEDLLKIPGVEEFMPAAAKELPKSKKVSTAAKALKEINVAHQAAGSKKTQIEEKICRWQSQLAQGHSDLLLAQLEFSDTGDQVKICQENYEAAIAEAPSQEVKVEMNGENGGNEEDEDEDMESEPAPTAPPEFTTFADTLEPDKRKLLDECMAAMWQTASGGKRRKKLEAAQAKQAADAMEESAKLFAAAAARAATGSAGTSEPKGKDMEKPGLKGKGKAGEASSPP
jgi:hypothetical protein